MATLYNSIQSSNLTTSIGGAVPGAGDTVILNNYSVSLNNASGNTINTNAIAYFYAMPGFTGNVGVDDSGGGTIAPLIIKTNSTPGNVYINWGGRFWYMQSTNASGVIDQITVDPAANGRVYLLAMDCARLIVLSGYVSCNSACDVDTALVSGGQAVFAESGPTLVTLKVMEDGIALVDRAITAATVSGRGFLHIRLETAIATLALNGGTCLFQGLNPSSAFNSQGGVLDLTQAKRAFTPAGGTIEGKTVIKLLRGGFAPDLSACTIRVPVHYEYVN